MNNYWGAMLTGALIGAGLTYYFINNEEKISCAVSRIKATHQAARDCFGDIEEDLEELDDLEDLV